MKKEVYKDKVTPKLIPPAAKRYKAFITDSMWSMAGLMLLYIIQQFILYPILRKSTGASQYGNMLFFLGINNIISVPVGCSANNSRLKMSIGKRDRSYVYDCFFYLVYLIFFVLSFVVFFFYNKEFNIIQLILFWLLICTTAYRNYADVEYRISTDYKGYFQYYAIISLGYILGIIIFLLTKMWLLAFLAGEIPSVIVVRIYKRNRIKTKYTAKDVKEIFFSIGTLLNAQLLVNIVLNADRFVLKALVGSSAVTIYYVASLFGKTAVLITAPLNSVILSHLAKRKENMGVKIFLQIAGGVCLASTGILVISTFISKIFVFVFYPNEYNAANNIFLLANGAQIFYFTTGILTTILLRYINEKYQLYINIVYIIIFALVTIPATATYGLYGFSVALLCVNIIRFLLAVLTGLMRLRL